MLRFFLSCVVLSTLTVSLFAATQTPEGWTVTERRELPPVTLRYFGTTSGRYVLYETPDGPVSRLEVILESEEKAELLHALYFHDHPFLGADENTVSAVVGAYQALEFGEQGCIVVARQGGTLVFVSGKDYGALAPLTTLAGMVRPHWVFEPKIEIPLPLRAMEDFPFRFYYWFEQQPRDVSPRDYRRLPEFDWAREQGTGFVDWVNVATNDTAEGMSLLGGVRWAIRAAERRALPVVVNTSLTNNQSAVTNRFAAEVQRGMPDFVGSFYCVADPGHAGVRELSWGSQAGKNAVLAALQNVVRETRGDANVIEYLEPHGELRHGNHDMYLEFGPVADESFRGYLKREYSSDLAEVARRWFGRDDALKSWDDVRVPEIASFAGWNPGEPNRCFDLKGDWRVCFEPPRGDPPAPKEPGDDPKIRHENEVARQRWERDVRAPAEWFAEELDDSDWPTIPAPGHDRVMFAHRRSPAVFRRSFTLPDDWNREKERVWIYVWDLNRAHGHPEQVWLNGRMVGEQEIPHPRNNVMAFEVTDDLRPGGNTVAVRTAEGFLSYKIYLAKHEPRWYPMLPPEENRRWVDFAGWWRWSRLDAVRRGLEMIREVEPDRNIVCMSPYSYFAGMRELCMKYGGHFHDTGGMSGVLAFDLPALMRSAGLPCSLEPGGPAGDPDELRRFTTLWAMEGINAVHYFIHIGAVLWNPEIRELFERLGPQIRFMGKHHIPRGEVASLMDDRISNLTDFPLIGPGQHNVFIRHEPGRWALSGLFTQEYYWDNITLYDFEAPRQENLTPYRTVVDTNCSILSEKQVGDIERWVRAGGVFVTHVQTGRHLPDRADAWPIDRLTGYRVTHVDPHDERGEARWRKLLIAENQPIFREENWPDSQRSGNGLSLEKVASECVDLLYWEDGSVAAGLRPLGKGYVVHLGAKFSNSVIWWGNGAIKTALEQVLDWRQTPKHPARTENRQLTMQPSVTNDFLFDVWTVANIDRDGCESRILFSANAPKELLELGTNRAWPLTPREDGLYETETMSFARNETRIFTAPRNRLPEAPLGWLERQRSWWKGAWKPEAGRAPLPPPPQDHTVDLNADWRFKPLADEENPEDFLVADLDDSAWERGALESWTVPEDSPFRRRVFRREITIPEHWHGGSVQFMFQGIYDNPFMGRGQGRLRIDGREIASFNRGVELEDRTPGKTYKIAIFCEGWTDLCGPSGNAWLAWRPDPARTQDLSGDWIFSDDALHWTEDAKPLPGPWPDGARFARRTFELPETGPDTQIFVRYTAKQRGLTGVIVNGRYLRRHHHDLSETTHLNVTPWLKPGEPNEIEIVGHGDRGQELLEVRLDFYEKDAE